MWPIENETKIRKNGKKIFYIMITNTFRLALTVGAFQSSNINEFVFLIVIVLSDLVVITKLNYVLWKSDKIDEFIRDFESLSLSDHAENERTQRHLKMLMDFILFYLWMLFASWVFQVILPAFSNERRLPFDVTLPLNWENSKFEYFIAYVRCECCCFYCRFIEFYGYNLVLNGQLLPKIQS